MTKENGFRQLGIKDMPADVFANWNLPYPVAAVLRGWLLSEMTAQLGINADPALWTDADRDRLAPWFNRQIVGADFAFRSDRHRTNLLFSNLSSKASLIAQRGCSICQGLASEADQFPVEILPIRIAPESRQSIGEGWTAYQEMMRDWFSLRSATFKRIPGLCLTVTFVLSTSRPDKDLDNMAKALGDAVSRALGFNDKHIHHFDLAKLRGNFSEEYVIVRAAPSHLSSDLDVMLDEARHVWGVGDQMRLDDYMTRSAAPPK